jgi:hypothetical protein
MLAESTDRRAIGRMARITGGAYVAFIATSYLADPYLEIPRSALG